MIKQVAAIRYAKAYFAISKKTNSLKAIVSESERLIKIISNKAVNFQSGYLYHYAFVMLGGLVIILTWFIYY